MPDEEATLAGTHRIKKPASPRRGNGNRPAGSGTTPGGNQAINKTGDGPPPSGYTAAKLRPPWHLRADGPAGE